MIEVDIYSPRPLTPNERLTMEKIGTSLLGGDSNGYVEIIDIQPRNGQLGYRVRLVAPVLETGIIAT